MKKTKKENAPASHEGKGFLTLAGEALSVLGEEIVEGKDKLVAAASEKMNEVKKAIKKARKASAKKKSAKKSTAGKKRK